MGDGLHGRQMCKGDAGCSGPSGVGISHVRVGREMIWIFTNESVGHVTIGGLPTGEISCTVFDFNQVVL